MLDQFRPRSDATIFPNLTWKDLVDGGYVIAGSPETVLDRMKDMITTLRLGHVFCLMHNGNMPDWKTRYSTKLFAEKVMPHLQQHVAGPRRRRPLVDPAARGPACVDDETIADARRDRAECPAERPAT